MSWSRYLTLESFCQLNPDWSIILHLSKAQKHSRPWHTREVQDCGNYTGKDYLESVSILDIKIQEWSPPFKNLPPAHASDLFQWELLSTIGGFYADMDVLFTKSLPYSQWRNQDTIYCNSKGQMSIGFLGASPRNRLFQAVRAEALEGYSSDSYQNAGVEAVYRAAGLTGSGRKLVPPGVAAMYILKSRFTELRHLELPDRTIYPWAWNELENIWNIEETVPQECVGIHWFGGARKSQEMNNILTPQNMDKYPSTFTRYAKYFRGKE